MTRMSKLHRATLLALLSNILLFDNRSNAFISTTVKSNIKSSTSLPPLIINNRQKSIKLKGKLWDRVEIEERDEIGWYLLNCVVSNELALKSQVDLVLADFPKDEVEQISVPTSKSIRSHGKRHVVDDIVLYPGYVFVKIKLTCDVYEAIQCCTLCRSFMGTIRMKGMYTSLPSIPTMLSPEEVDEFKGLESKLQAQNEETPTPEEMLKPYKGYEVGQMVKILNGKFKGEDGLIKRLKNLKISVRLFTYGSNYDAWFEPDDIRLLSDGESMSGLSGPDKPIYNRQFQEIVDPDKFKKKEDRFARDSSGRNFGSVFGAGSGRRNRKQDRVFRGDAFYSQEEDRERQEHQNWENYKRKQSFESRRSNSSKDIERAMAHEPGNDFNQDWMSPTKPKSDGLDFLNDMMMESEPKKPKKKTKDDFLNTLLEDFDTSFGGEHHQSNDDDDFFATLEQEMSSLDPPKEEIYKDDDDNFTFLENENEFKDRKDKNELNILEYDGSKPQKEFKENLFKDDDDLLNASGGDDDFFDSLDLDDLYSSQEDVPKEKTHEKSKPVKASNDYNESALKKYTVPQLKEQLRSKNLKVSGKKSELIQRLLSS